MKFILSLFMLFMSILSFGQHSISGIINSQTGSLIGSDISLYKMNSEVFYGTVTEADGSFSISNVEAGEYRMVVNYLGFKKHRERITIERDLVLNPITLEEDIIEIDGVEITGTMIQAIQKGDTTVFNAGAFKTLPDADAKELIAKIPGIQINGGTITANGENVQKVTVDGREFFGTDPNIALNALPAEIIARIEIIDEQSEQSQFTGFNDGNTTKTINIVTKTDKRNGEFGKVYLGHGDDNRYQTGGNINIFKGDQRISIIGLSNNINQQNFSTEDLLGVVGSSGNNRRGRRGRGGGGANNFLIGQQAGIARTHSIGLNFSDKWGEKVDFSGSYFFNRSDNTTIQNIEQEYFSEDAEGDLYNEANESFSNNMNHRVQGILNVKFDDKNSLRYRPRISWQNNDTQEFSSTSFLRANGIADNANNDYFSDRDGYNLNHSLRFRHSFEKRGRTLSFSLGQSRRPSDGNSLLSSSLMPNAQATSIDEQLSESTGSDDGYSAEVSYTEPIGERGSLSVDYEVENDNGEDLESTYNGPEAISAQLINSLSNNQNTDQLTQTFSTAYRWRKEKTTIMARARLENTDIKSSQILPNSFETDKSYLQFLPFLMLRTELSETSNLRLFYRPRTNNPSANQLSETIDNSNPLQLSKGNVDIEQSFQHSLFARYSSTNNKKGTVFYLFAGGDYSNNYIGQRTYLDGNDVPLFEELNIDRRAQLTVPENLGGFYSLRSYVTIGLPVTSIKSKLNFNLSGNYSSTPSVIDDQENDNNNANIGIGASLTSNISTNVDFTISSNTNIGSAENTLQPELGTTFLNQTTALKLDVIFPYGIIWRNQINHQIFSGYGEDFDDSFLLGIMSIGKKFLKNDRAEISLSVFDLFNQNQAISRVITSTYNESITSNVLQRYFMVNFKYDLRHFGKAPKVSSSRGPGGRGFRGGGPPGGRGSSE